MDKPSQWRNPGAKGGFNVCLLEDLGEVFHLAGTGGGDDRYGNAFADMFDQFDIKATVGTIFVDTVE
jgi:hypothetical protein